MSSLCAPPRAPWQSFAENTMNELLGWYGYDKVELRDSDDIEIRNYPDGEARQHISVLKGERRCAVCTGNEEIHKTPERSEQVWLPHG